MVQLVNEKQVNDMKSLRFGGISPVVLRELSGVYQPFVKAVKEIISNAYDADAGKVDLYFKDDFRVLSIVDNGSGMNPIEFVRDYIRIGKSQRKDDFTAEKKRPRIGGKGIGFLAPARYCDVLEIKTKKSGATSDKIVVELNGQREFNIEQYLLQGHEEKMILEHVKLLRVTDPNGIEIGFMPFAENKFNIILDRPLDACEVHYELDSSKILLTARIDFGLLFSLDASKSLEDIENFCELSLGTVGEEYKSDSFTEITLLDVKDFVRSELSKKGKKGARNIESGSGIDQFLWNLSRIIPVKAELHDFLPAELRDYIDNDIDGGSNGYPIEVNCSIDYGTPLPLERFVIKPDRNMDMSTDADILKLMKYGQPGDDFYARGFLVGQSSTIYPAESRGILLRVRGVAIGEPTYFGLDQTLTGSAKVALSQISGEINILTGIDAINDINPGRDGFYKESKTYNFLRKELIGDNPDKLSGDLKNVIDAIIMRSEVNASINNFVKRHEAQRNAILEASVAISEISYESPEVLDQFMVPSGSYQLQLSPVVPYKAEGKLASFVVKLVDDIEEPYKIDYVAKELHLNSKADLWKRNINIGGMDFEIQLKQGKQKALFCEVNPSAKKIYINWDHPMRSTLGGDAGYIKHCLATVASALPQEQLNTYIRLITNKI